MNNSKPHKILPYGRQTIDDDDIASVIRALKSDYLTTGPITVEFEDAFAHEVEASHAIAINSGTSGLHLAMLALGIGAGDAVIVPSLTFLASANCVEYVGGDVVFADVNPDTGLMEIEHIKQAMHDGVKAIILVHLNGQTTDLDAIKTFAQNHNLYIIEDACHALGGTFISHTGQRQKIGNAAYSDITMFSGHPVKTIAMGEAGILTTNNDALADKLRLLRSHNMEKNPERFTNKALAFDTYGSVNPWYYEMHEPGYNFRCSDIHCALGLSQIKKLKEFVRKRQELVDIYLDQIKGFAPAIKPITHTGHGEYGWHLFPVLCDFSTRSRKVFMEALSAEGILTQVHYIPVSEQPYYKAKYPTVSVPGAMEYYNRILSLPLYPSMTPDDVTTVTRAIKQVITT